MAAFSNRNENEIRNIKCNYVYVMSDRMHFLRASLRKYYKYL